MTTVAKHTSVWLIAGLLAMGCGDDGGGDGNPGDTSADAAVATPDAAPVIDTAPVIDAEPPGPDATPPPMVDVHITVEYEGEAPGEGVVVAAFTSWPPSGPPLSFGVIEESELPQTATLEGFVPGTYYFYAAYDVPPISPMPGMEDPQGVSEAVEVDGTDDIEITIVVEDPVATE